MATSAGSIPITATFNAAQLEKDVLSALTRIQSKSTLNLNTRNFTQPLGKITGLANEFNKSLEASNARVVAFGASAGVIFAVQKSFSALITSTIEVEKSLIDINIVLNTSAKGIKQFGDQLFEVARSTGSSFKDVAAAATEFSRQGLGLEETLRRTRDALILTRLSGLDVVSSTEALTAAVNSFTKEALTTTDVVNKLAAVDAKFAVSSRDLSEALQRVGSSASEAGVSFDELLGIVTSVQQTTARGGAVIGNALKTIFTRIERPQVINDLKDFGITVTDISGNVLPTIKVIENLAQSFQSLNPVVKSQVAELVGGVYQINILKAALADVSKQNSAFAEATRASSQAADEAILKNDALNKSLSALINETSANFSQFASAIGNASVAPGIRKVLESVNKSLSAYNEKDSEGVGAKIATGLLTGITDFITGPGLLLGGLAVGKLLSNFTKFAGDATKNILGLNSVGRQQAVLQGEISKILSSNPELIQQILSGTKTRLQVEKEIRQTLYEQAALAKTIVNITESQAKRMIVSGVVIDQEGQFKSKGRVSAGGFIPAQQQAAEKVGAMQGGYTPGKVVAAPKSIGGVMNTAEKVKYIPGFAQPYILPPEGSRAAQSLASKSMAKNGINPYMARGFVPNFGPMPLENDAYGYGDNEWLRRASRDPVPLAQIRLDPKYEAAFDPSRPKGERFYRKDGAPFTGNDLNHFVRAGAKYGEIRAEMPASILMSDKRYGKRKPDGTIFGLDDIRATYAPGKKIEAEQKIKEGIKQVYDPYIPPASMLVFDAMQKSSERDVNEDDLEKTGEMSTKRKTSGRIFKIKSYALNASALNEEKTGLIQKTQDFSRKMTKDLANYIRPGEYSDTSVDNFFGAAGKNYNVLAGTIFEASTNLAGNYTRDKADSGGDFDVRGGSIANVRELFPGFTDQYGDYKLKNNDEAIRSFIDKVTKQYGQQIGNHFKEQEIKAGSVTSGLKTNSSGFIPNFAPKPFNFRFSSLGEKTAQISPKLRDWLADKYFDPEMASTGTLERLASLNRDSGAFFSSLENPNAVAGIPVRGQQGFVSRQNRGARAGAFLNALRARLPDFVPGSLPNLASGFIPNFAYRINKPVYSKTSTRELTDPETGSYLRYYPGDFYNKETKSQERSLNVSYIRSKQTGQGQEMFDRFSKMARRQKLKGFSDLLVEQGDRVGKIIPKEKYGYLKEKLSADEIKNYSILEDTSFEDIVKMAYPQLAYRQRGLSKNTKLSLNYRDYAGFLKYEDLSGKDILSQVQNKLKDVYGNNKDTLIQEILHKNIGINDLQDTFSKGYVPNFANQDIEILRAIININKRNAATTKSPHPVLANPKKDKGKTALYRGVEATSERWRSIDRNDPNAVRKAVFSQADYANQIPEYNPKESFIGTSFKNLATTHIGNPLEKKDLLHPTAMRNYRLMYGYGYDRSLPIISTSKRPSVAREFAGRSGATSGMMVNDSRLLGDETLYDDLYRKYGERKVKEVMFRQSKSGGGRGMGLDFNDIFDNSIYKSEYEVGLFSNGYVPNFSYAVSKPGFNRSASKRQIHDKKTGSYLEYTPGVVDSEKVLKFGFINSYEKGQGHEMFDRYGKIARRSGRRSYSSIILPQTNKIVPKEKYDLLNEYQKKNRHILEGLSLRDALKISYPQLMYRERGISKDSSVKFMKTSTEKSPFEMETLTGKKIFSSILDKLTGIYGSDVPEFVKDVEARKIYISELYDTFSKGHVPNFAYKLKKRKQYENDKKNNFRTLTDPETGSILDYYPGNFVNPNTGSYEKGLKISYIESNQKGQGQEMFDRYSKTAKRLGVNSYSSVIVPQGDKLKRVIPQKQYALLRDKDKEKHYVLEETSIEDIVKIAYPQLSYRQKGLSKSTNLKFSNRNYVGRMEEEEIFGKNILSLVQGKIKDLYKNDKQSFIDAVIDGDLAIEALVDTFSKGHIPNFNAVQEAIGREMAAGYSSSQVKVGQSSKLKTSFNPMGLGVYNSTEGSLNGGIGLAEKAGINPKTKGMSAKGHIPNFAEFGGVDATISVGALMLFYSAIKDITGEFKNFKDSLAAVKKEQISAVNSYSQSIGEIPKSLAKKEAAIQNEIQSTFTNVDERLRLTGTSTGALVNGPFTMDPLSRKLSRTPQAASAEQVARLDELRKQLAEERKQTAVKLKEARASRQEATDNFKRTQDPIFGKGMFQGGSKFSTLSKTMGPSVGFLGSSLANIVSEFIPKENRTAKAAASGIGDVLSSVGAGAAFGLPGMAVGGVYGLVQLFRKLEESKAAEAIEKINNNLEITKQKASDFSGAAQNYATSLEGLQSALNDPKAKPATLLKFQTNLTEALSSIPDEFRNKVLQAGADITKVSEAIAGVNKELGNTQKNLERQLAISSVIKDSSSIFGNASVSGKDQKSLNALFSSSIDAESVAKNFKGDSATEDLNSFFEKLTKQATFTQSVYSYGVKTGEQPALNRQSVGDVKAQLKNKGILTESIADILDSAFGKLDVTAVKSIIDVLQKQSLAIVDSAKKVKILSEISDVNTKRILANAEALKTLNNQYNDINLQISNQIDIEKNRAKTIREINKIQAEGVVSTQRARVKGALDAFTPFVGEGAKNDIQNQLDVNEINTRQNSQIRDATGKFLDSLSDSITKKAEEARSKIVPAIEGARDDKAIQKERSVFQQQINNLTPLISEGLRQVNAGGDVSTITQSLKKRIIESTGPEKAFTKETSELLIQSLDSSFSELQNELARIKAQGDVDLDIQKASREYQKQSLALNQRLSFAGGAQALGSTGKSGVSDLFDSLSELVSEFRQTNAIGSAAQKGSTSFKFLDVLTNQLQLNRGTETPAGFANAQSFNKQVSSDLNPLAATAIAGRVKQIRDSLNLAKDLTEIQTGKSTEGTALGTAFDQANQGAVKTALDQIASQFKLENMGTYLDVLQQEARYLNDLTQKQNELLASALPTSINENFNKVITTQVGSKLDELTGSLTGVINKLSTNTQRATLLSERSNLLPIAAPDIRRAISDKIDQTGDLTNLPKEVKFIDNIERKLSTTAQIKDIESYLESLKTIKQAEVQPLIQPKELQIYQPPTAMDEILTGLQRYQTEEEAVQSSRKSAQISYEAETKLKEAKSTVANSKYEGMDTRQLEQLLGNLKGDMNRFNEPGKQDYLTTTYEGLAKQIFREFGQQMSIEDLKSLKENSRRQRSLEAESPLMSGKKTTTDAQKQFKFYEFNSQPNPQVPEELARTRANVNQVNARGAIRTRNAEELAALNKEVEGLLAQKNQNAEQEARLLKKQIELREKGLQVENDNAKYNFDLYYKKAYGKKFFKDERAAFANAEIESEARQGNVDIGAITEKNTTYNRADFAKDTGQLIDTFQTDFKSGIGSAFGEAIKGTKTLKDAFRDMFQGILNRMLDKSLEMGVDALFAFGKAYATGRKDGGPIKGYNSGGMVTGGSGMKDDVPAMMSGGEYVIKKSSVDKYGTDYLRNLNGGAVPRYATGGFSIGPLQNEFLYDNPDRPTSGEYAVDSRLSAAALTDDSNPQNKLREDRYEKLDQYLQDRAQYERDKKQSIKNYKNQVNSTFYSGLTAAAVQIGAAGLTAGAESLRKSPTPSNIPGAGLEPGGSGFSQAELNSQYKKYGRANGGYIAKFAGGGSTGQDNIPALLMGGEYVMNKKAVDMYGKDFMGQLNSGSLPKYASGGMVGTSYSGQSNTDQSSSMDELVTALNTLNDNLSKDSGITQSESGRSSLAGATQESGMSVVNNISINMSQGGEVTSEANSSTQKGASNSKTDQNSMQNNGKLAELLRSKVVEVLVEQKRPGGLLYSSR